jgi:hypothetical protein
MAVHANPHGGAQRTSTCAQNTHAVPRPACPDPPADHVWQPEAHARLPELRRAAKLPHAQQLEQPAPQQRDLVADGGVEGEQVAGGAHKRQGGAAQLVLGVLLGGGGGGVAESIEPGVREHDAQGTAQRHDKQVGCRAARAAAGQRRLPKQHPPLFQAAPQDSRPMTHL